MRAGPWLIEEELGRGGMGVVYAARHVQIGKRAALKVMHRRLVKPEHARRMELEARVVNQIGHPNIVDIFDVGTTGDGRPYIVMEQLTGHSLGGRDLDIEEAIAILAQVTNALIAAHAAGVVHRDLKPDNIFLAQRPHEPPRVVILDWGIARVLDDDAKQTLEGELLGTPTYIAPEQARGEAVTAKTDVYSLGVVAYELVLLRPPFDAETTRDLMAMHLFVTPPAPRRLWPEIPPRLESLLRDMLAKEPALRPTMKEVAARLVGIAHDLRHRRDPPRVPQDVRPVRTTHARKRRWPAVIGLVATVTGVVLVLTRGSRDTAPRSQVIVEPAGKVIIEAEQDLEAPVIDPPSILTNPVLENCADPAVAAQRSRWYMTCTGGRGGKLYPIYESPNLHAWRRVGWVFPTGERPAWGDGHHWSPELHAVSGGFAAYFTTRVSGGRNAIGLAMAATITGPYRDAGAPLMALEEGASDPHVLVDRGRRYLFFKREGKPPSIEVQPLTSDGRGVVGEPRRLLVAEMYEHDNIEAPWVIRHRDHVYLFYSSGRYCDADYTVWVARSRSPLGPFERRVDPVLASGMAWAAPGHVTIAERGGERFLVYHAYRLSEGMPTCDGQRGRRHVRIDPLRFEAGWPVVDARL